jgi:malonyl-CoA/methylmalonyl-CoA synthetase
MSFYHHLSARWATFGGVAVEHGDVVLTYAMLPSRVARAVALLRSLGVGRGDVVALQLPRSVAWLELHLAALAIGAITLPLHDRYTAPELAYFLDDSRARVAFVATELAPSFPGAIAADAVRAALDAVDPGLVASTTLDATVEASEIACILYTSGTTGRPKGALITHANLLAGVAALDQAWRWSSRDVLVHALPLFHVHGLFVALHGALWAGATAVWMDRFEPVEALRLIEARATVFMGVPTFYQRFCSLPPLEVDLSRVRLFTCGSAGLPARLWNTFRDRFGHAILERYGMTEVGIVVSNPYEGERRPGSIGLPLPGVLARVVGPAGEVPDGEVGELRISGPTVFSGYLGQPAKTAEALAEGEMHTGDLAIREPGGYLRLVGRARDLVICGGFNVYPSEIEAVLLEHPGVAEAAVVGVPDPDLGERLVANVIVNDRAEIKDLAVFCVARLAPYKRPRWFRVVADLPRNAMGKVEKSKIEAQLRVPVVRDAIPAEAEAIADRNVKMARETEGIALDPAVARRGAAAAPSQGARYFIADIAGVCVGQCMVTTEWSDWRDAPVWWLQSVYVEPGWRGTGVYRSLHEHVVAAAKEAGAAGLRLYVDTRNTSAQEVYRRVGMNGDHYRVFEQMFSESR